MIADAPKPAQELLNSWKEIAVYLNRGVRTVQRWELELGLPVRRPRGRRHSAVIAKRSELDAWMASCPLTQNGRDERSGRFAALNHSGLRFLLTEIQSGLTFAHLAGSAAPHQTEKIQRNLTNARRAYQAVLKFRNRVQLDEIESLRLSTGMERLKAVLEGLAGGGRNQLDVLHAYLIIHADKEYHKHSFRRLQ